VPSIAARVVLVVAAVLAVAWLAVGLRAVELQADGESLLSSATAQRGASGEVREGRELLERARRFNADMAPLIAQSRLLTLLGRVRDARAAAEEAVSTEPDNVDSWIALYVVSRAARDEDARARALREIRRLNPIAAEAFQRDERAG
jgi:hypothetical protein